jgi:hypothetical protein
MMVQYKWVEHVRIMNLSNFLISYQFFGFEILNLALMNYCKGVASWQVNGRV